MTSWSSANHRRKRILRRRIYVEAKLFHEQRVTRLYVTRRTDKLKNSGYLVRLARRQRELRRDKTGAILP